MGQLKNAYDSPVPPPPHPKKSLWVPPLQLINKKQDTSKVYMNEFMQSYLVESNNFIGSYEIHLVCPILWEVFQDSIGKLQYHYTCFDEFLLNILLRRMLWKVS
jgi:hypothetical protein